MTNKTNWLAIIVTAVIGMGLGFLWYGVLFLDTWAAGNYITMDEAKEVMFKNGVEVAGSWVPMVANTVAMIVYALIMNWLINRTNSTSWGKGAALGGIIGSIVTINTFVTDQFAANPSSLRLVDGSYELVLFTVFGAIIGGWRK